MDSSSGASQDESYIDTAGSNDLVWTLIWVISLCIFLSLPFCSNAKRRRLCRERIRERRWVQDDGEDDWYVQAVIRRREERRQQMEADQEHFRTTKTQEDEIREQYLLLLLDDYTMVRQANEWTFVVAYYSHCITPDSRFVRH